MLDREFLPYRVNPKDLRTESPFKDLFPIQKPILEAVADSMRANGYDEAFPIIVWHGVIVDGHTRLLAAKRAHIRDVLCHYREFKDVDEALTFAISAQTKRRNLTDADIFRCVQALDERRDGWGGDRKSSAPNGALDPQADRSPVRRKRSSDKTAALLGVSARKVERARVVLDHAPEKVKQAVAKGEKTINAVSDEIAAARKSRSPRKSPLPVPRDTNIPAPDKAKYGLELRWTAEATSREEAKHAFCEWIKSADPDVISLLLAVVEV